MIVFIVILNESKRSDVDRTAAKSSGATFLSRISWMRWISWISFGPCVIPKAKDMTLGPKFYTKLVLPTKCYFCLVIPYFLAVSATFYL